MQKSDIKIEKAVVNVGIGRLSSQPNFNDKILPAITEDIAAITGQKPMLRPAKKSISGFKLRQGTIVGLKVTLRGKRMEQFLSKVVRLALPRVRDFRGISAKGIDKNDNLTFGIKDYLVFPEISPEASKVNFGIEITLVPKEAKSRDEAVQLYKSVGIPFQKNG
jgi:large subunit ribosomal protein L5